MINDNMLCVFCRENTCLKVIKFTPATLQKCRTVLEYRRHKLIRRKSRTTYHNVELPETSSSNEGYHAQCYRWFTAVKIPADFVKIEQQAAVFIKSEPVECNAQAMSGETSESYFPVPITVKDDGTSPDIKIEQQAFAVEWHSSPGLHGKSSETNIPAYASNQGCTSSDIKIEQRVNAVEWNSTLVISGECSKSNGPMIQAVGTLNDIKMEEQQSVVQCFSFTNISGGSSESRQDTGKMGRKSCSYYYKAGKRSRAAVKRRVEILRKAKEEYFRLARERQKREQEALALAENGDGAEGMAVDAVVEKPKPKPRPSNKPEPVQILGDLDEKTLRARPEPKPMPVKVRKVYKKKVPPTCTEGASTGNVAQSVDGGQNGANENDAGLLMETGSGPAQSIPEIKLRADGTPMKKRASKTKRSAPKKQPGAETDGESKPKKKYNSRPYDGRKMIAKVYHFLEREFGFLKELLGPGCDISPLANLVARTAEATGVTERTVQTIVAEDRQQKAMQRTLREEKRKQSREEWRKNSVANCVKENVQPPPEAQIEINNSVTNPEDLLPLNTVNVVNVQIIQEMSELDSAVASIGGEPLGLQYESPAVNNQLPGTSQLQYLSPAVITQLPGAQFNQLRVLEVSPLEIQPPEIKSELDITPAAVETHNIIPKVAAHECMDLDIPPEVKSEPAESWDDTQPAPLTPLIPHTTTSLHPPPVNVTEVGSTLFVTYTDD